MGVISKLLGIIFVVAGGAMFFLGSGDQSLYFLYYFLGLTVMAMGFSLLTAGGKKEEKPPPPTVTEISCDNSECTFKEIRDFQKGDFILKALETKCPKCQGSMTIQGVYMVREEETLPNI
jgi:hypothetical protein